MIRSPLTYALAALLCGAVFFSCTPTIDPPPPIEQQSSSSNFGKISSQGGQSSNGSETGYSSSSQVAQRSSSSSIVVPKSSSSKAQITTGCAEKNPIEDFYCGWDVTGILTPGTEIMPESDYLPDDCSSIAWKYAPDVTDMALMYECLSTDEYGIVAEGSRKYVLFAELTCKDGKHTTACNPKDGLMSKVAPILEGQCKWDKNPTTTARGATPSGVKVVDVDGVCRSPTVSYKYNDGTEDWPKTGIVEAGTYTDVEATLNCPAYPVPITSSCPPLEVKDGAEHLIECTCTGDGDNGECDVIPAPYPEFCTADGVAKSKSVTLKKDECVKINIWNYNNKYLVLDVGMRCDAQGTATVSINGTSKTFTYNSLLSLGKINIGDNELGTLCFVSGDVTEIKCTGPSM